MALESDPADAGLEPWRVTRPASRTALTASLPLSRPLGLPVYVAASQLAPFSSRFLERGLVAASKETHISRAGGRGGIRTHGEFNPTLDFESSALNRTQPPFPGVAFPSDGTANYGALPGICKPERGIGFRKPLSRQARAVNGCGSGAKNVTNLFLPETGIPPHVVGPLGRLR